MFQAQLKTLNICNKYMFIVFIDFIFYLHVLFQGSDVNARDYCGWLPIHEACNHGHLGPVHPTFIYKQQQNADNTVEPRSTDTCFTWTPQY